MATSRADVMTLAHSCRKVLAEDPVNARPIVAALLNGRVTFTPQQGERRVWEIRWEGTLIELFPESSTRQDGVATGNRRPVDNRFLSEISSGLTLRGYRGPWPQTIREGCQGH